MGWDIVSVGNHLLNTSNIEILAYQLSEALDINVRYGYFQVIKYNAEKKMIEKTNNFEINIIGEVKKSRYLKIYYLVNENFIEDKILDVYKNNPNDIKFDDKSDMDYENYHFIKQIEEFKKGNRKFNLYRESKRRKPLDLVSAFIANDMIKFSVFDPFRWFDFVNQLKKNNEYFDDFVKYRNRMAEYYKKVGAEQIVYFSDQGVTEIILDKVWDTNWKELLEYIKTQEYHFEFVKIPFNDDFYIKYSKEVFDDRHNALQINISDFFLNGNPFYEVDDNLEILFDDFKDLSLDTKF